MSALLTCCGKELIVSLVSYEDGGYKKSDLAKMVFLLNGKPVDALALIVHRSAEQTVGRAWVKKLRKGLISLAV